MDNQARIIQAFQPCSKNTGTAYMEERGRLEEFSLLGGPLHRLGRRLGLVRGETNTVAVGFALGLILWSVLVALAFFEGIGRQLFSLSVIGGHVRLLLVIPLFFVCEAALDPRLTAFVRTIVSSGVVSGNALVALESEIARIGRWKDSWLPDAACLALAALLSFIGPQLQLSGTTMAHDPGLGMTELPLAGQWYWIVCLSLFRFLILRWLWRLGVWYYFLWRISRLDLKLIPTHPDGLGGLGYMEVVQTHFFWLVMAISLVYSASFAEEISTGAMTFEAIYPALVLILVVEAVLFLGPPFLFFAPRLWACRMRGLSSYMIFASRYVNGFDRKWLARDAPSGEDLLGTADLQSLADLGNSINLVRDMRWIPASPRLLAELAIAALLPMLPLLLLKYPVADLAEKIFTNFFGL